MKLSSLLTAALIAVAAIPATAPARQANTNQSMAAMPPALRAAVQSGNTQAIIQAINTLSAGDSQRMATLTAQVVRAGEAMLSVNPNLAAAAAAAAVSIMKTNPQVQSAAPALTQEVLITAARIVVNPQVQQINPTAAAAVSADIRSVVAANPNLQTGTFAAQLAAVLPSAGNTNTNTYSNNPITGRVQSETPSSSGSGSGSGGGGSTR